MKRMVTVALFLVCCLSVFSNNLRDCLADYSPKLAECVKVFNQDARETCIWGAKETLRAEIDAMTRQKGSDLEGASVLLVAFFRNEGKRIITECDELTVPRTGDYYFTFFNGTPTDSIGPADSVSFSVSEGGKKQRLIEQKGMGKNELFDAAMRLEKGKRYAIVMEELKPVASYVTVIVTDKKLLR